MKKKYNNILTVFFLFLLVQNIAAQKFVGEIKIISDPAQATQTHLLTFYNGDEKEGLVLAIDNNELTFYSNENLTTSTFQLSEIKIIAVKGAEDIEPEPVLPKVKGNNRLLYSETGFSLEAGELEYHTVWGIIHTVDYGITDGFTVGIGTVYPGYALFHTKMNFINGGRFGKFRLGVDFKTALRPIRVFDDLQEKEIVKFRGFFQFNLFTSYGTEDRNIHLGFNVIPIFEPNNFIDDGVISFSFGGTIRVAPHWKVVYENTFGGLTNGNGPDIVSGIGVSWFNEAHVITAAIKPSLNFGFMNFPLSDTNTMHELPFLSYSYFF